MSSQDTSPLSDASIHHARQHSGILTPSSQSVELNDELRGKKRKRDANSLEDLLTDKFVIKVGLYSDFLYCTKISHSNPSHIPPNSLCDREPCSHFCYYHDRIYHFRT